MNFEVLTHDVHGEPVHCSYCDRGAKRVVMLPLAEHPALRERLRGVDGSQLLGLCAYCVLDMAKALQFAEARA